MIEPSFVNNYDDTYTVSSICACGQTTTATVPAPAVFQWRQGAFAQVAFPMLTADQREALFVTGICAKCWDRMFPEEDEDDTYTSGEQYYADRHNSDSYINYLNG